MNPQVESAWVGVVAGIVGGLLTLTGTFVSQRLVEAAEKRRDEPRRRLLKQMLSDDRFAWRRLETLMHVVGASEETTKRLLIDIGARGSEDGKNLWGLISRNPFPETQ